MTLPIPFALAWCIQASQLENVALEWPAMRELLRRETGTYNVTSRHTRLRNPRSTAYGLGQFLNGTWRGTGIPKTSDPILQLRAMYRYIHARYGSASRALAFHKRRRWY